MTGSPRPRSPIAYRLALVLPVLVFLALYASGLWSGLRPPGRPPGETEFLRGFAASILWLFGIGPLLYLSWELGHQHTRARRLHNELFVGFYELVAIAIKGEPSPRLEREFRREPKDEPWTAAMWGFGVALLVPGFFSQAAPQFRTPRGWVWLCGAGLLMGSMMYCQRRSVAYLVDEPEGYLFRQWSLLNPTRYSARGRPFVRGMIAIMVILPIWWLFGGAWVMSS